MLIIGYGTRDRSDDAIGIFVAERLLDLAVPALIHTGDALELMELWRGESGVIVVDAMMTGAAIGTVHLWGAAHVCSAAGSPASSHGLGVAEAIAMSENLGWLPKQLRFYGIEGRRFGIGEEISPEVMLAGQDLAYRIAGEARSELSFQGSPSGSYLSNLSDR